MSKERLAAFTDAVLAIIMTILVLELEKPEELNWQGLQSLAGNYFSYTLSFFWLGMLWVRLHNEWQKVERVSNSSVWLSLLLLFIASLVPYVTSIVDNHLDNAFAQGMYGIVIIALTLVMAILHKSVRRANLERFNEIEHGLWRMKGFKLDLLIKIIGFVVAISFYPPAMMISVLVSALFIVLPSHFVNDSVCKN